MALLSFAVPCAPGAFFNNSGPAAMCDPCPLHHYQNESEQTECKACPTGAFTIARGSSQLGDCRGIVQSIDQSIKQMMGSIYLPSSSPAQVSKSLNSCTSVDNSINVLFEVLYNPSHSGSSIDVWL